MYLEEEAFEVEAFGVVDADGMVGGMGQVADYADEAMGVGGGGENHGLEVVGRDGLRTAEGEKQAAGSDTLHSALVDGTVAFESLLEGAVIFGEGRGIEDDDIEGVNGRIKILENIGNDATMRCVRTEIEFHITVA